MHPALTLPAALPLSPTTVLPKSVRIGREEAREAALRELGRAIYHRDDPSPATRALLWLTRQIGEILDAASGVAPGGRAGLVGIAILLVLVAVAVRLRVGPVRRTGTREEALLSGRPRTANDHRADAERYAQAQRWAEAVRERLRAIARALEERAVLDARPGRTADELAIEGGAVLPAHAGELRGAARTFDDIWYGGRPATPDDYATLRQLDERLASARPALAGSPQ